MTTPLPPLQPPPRNLDSGTLENRVLELGRWMTGVYLRLKNTGLLSLLWTTFDFTGSRIVDILDRKHADLQNVLGNDPTSTDATKNKHGSNAQAKSWTDHGAATSGIHGLTGAPAEASVLSGHTGASTGVHGITGALAANSDLTSHTGATGAHGVSTVAGISETQNISNKKLMNIVANVQALGTDYNVTNDDLAMAGTATMTFFLPAGTTGRVFAFKNIGGAGVTVTITAAGANTIEGAGSITIANGIAAVLCFGNSMWYKLTG